MDYSNDACMTTFTPGQAARMTVRAGCMAARHSEKPICLCEAKPPCQFLTQDMWHTYRAIAPALPTGSVLLSSPSSVAAIAASASAVANLNQKTRPAPKPTSSRPKPTPKPTAHSGAVTVLPDYAQCGGIAGSPVCSPHCNGRGMVIVAVLIGQVPEE